MPAMGTNSCPSLMAFTMNIATCRWRSVSRGGRWGPADSRRAVASWHGQGQPRIRDRLVRIDQALATALPPKRLWCCVGIAGLVSPFANQAWLLWHVAAYILCVAVREAAHGTAWATAQGSTLRTRLLKIGAQIVETCRKVWWHLPTSCPVQQEWTLIVQRLC